VTVPRPRDRAVLAAAALGAALCFFSPSRAHGSPRYPDELRAALALAYVPTCGLCHGNAADAAAGPAFLSFDIDFVDPAFAPGTGTIEVGGPTSAQALSLLRACRGLDIVAADVVEVAPDLDHSHLTTVMAATVAYEILTLIALARSAAGTTQGRDT